MNYLKPGSMRVIFEKLSVKEQRKFLQSLRNKISPNYACLYN